MKKILNLFLVLIVVLFITACDSEENKNDIQTLHNIIGLSKNSVWISKDGIKYDLVNLDGEVIYSLNEKYKPISKVIDKYFLVEEKESNKKHLFNLSGEELFDDSDKVELKSAHKKNKFTSDYSYAISVWYQSEDNENNIEMYLLDDELTDITDDYVNGNYAITNMYHVNDADGINRPDVLVNPTGNKFYEYYLKINNGTFTLVKDGEELYEPFNGTVKIDSCGSYNVIAKIDNHYYIVSEEGSKKEINYIPDGYSIDEYCDGYIVASAKFVNTVNETKTQAKIFNSLGKEINFIK